MEPRTSYSKQALGGSMWIASSSIARQATAFAVNVVLARILVPQDFGAVAVVSSLLACLQVLGELGMSVALVQREKIIQATLDSAFFGTICCSTLLAGCIWLFSAQIAFFYTNPILENLFKIAAFLFVLQGINSFHQCLLLRSFKYKEIALVNSAGIAAFGMCSIALAAHGLGPYSIVLGQVASAIIISMAVWTMTRYKPGLDIQWVEMRSLLSFGAWVSVNRLLGNLGGKVDAMIIGRFVGAAALGGYDIAQRLVLTIPSTILGILDQTLFPIYSRMQEDKDRMARGYWESLSISSLVALPPVNLIFLLAPDIVFILLGIKWLETVPLIRIMAIFAMCNCLGGGIFSAAMYASGKSKSMTLISVFRVITLPVCLVAGSRWGIIGVAWGFSIYGILGRLFNQTVIHYSLGYSLNDYLK